MTVFVDENCPIRGGLYRKLRKAIKDLYQESRKSRGETAMLVEKHKAVSHALLALLESYPPPE